MTDPTRTDDGPPTASAAGSSDTRSHVPDINATQTVGESLDPSSGGLPTPPPGYEILGELGRGGMGRVYRARQTGLNRIVALKMVRGFEGADATAVVRFLAEAEAVAAVRHPNVVQVYESGRHGDCPYMALEYLPGGSLARKLADGPPLDPRAVAELVAKLSDAAHAAHTQDIVHRDLKPSNVLFDDRGEPKVTDFGLAKRAASDLTRTQAVMGTPAYMAPEQASGGTKFVGPAADVWALGVILYECLTGKRPFWADDPWALLQRILHENPVAPRRLRPGLPRDLELIALKCLEKNPADRYPSAEELGADLRRFLTGKPVSVRPAGRGERLAKWCRRNPVVAGFSTALAAVTLLGLAGVTWGLLRAEERGNQLAKANDDLTGTLADLAKAEGEAARAEDAEARGYLSDVALAHQLWKANDLRGMRATLARCPEKCRKWEWFYLDRLSRPEHEVIPTAHPVGAMAYSPDGSLLANLTRDGTLTVRDVAAGKDRFRIETDENPPLLGELTPFPTEKYFALIFRPDGKELAYLYAGKVWAVELADGARRQLVTRYMALVAIGYDETGTVLAAEELIGGEPRKLRYLIREWPTGRRVAELYGPPILEGWVTLTTAAAFSPDGARFAAVVVDTGNRVATGKFGRVMPKPPNPSLELAPPPRVAKLRSRVNDYAVTANSLQPTVTVWDVGTRAVLLQEGTTGGVLAGVALHAEGIAYTAGMQGTYEDDLDDEAPRMVVAMPTTAPVYAVAAAQGWGWSGGEDRVVRGARWGSGRRTFLGCPNPILRLAATSDGHFVAAACADPAGGPGSIHVFDTRAADEDSWRSEAAGWGFVNAVSPAADRFAEARLRNPFDRSDVQFFVRGFTPGDERGLKLELYTLPVAAMRADGALVISVQKKRLLVISPDRTERVLATDGEEAIAPVLAWTPDGKAAVAVGAGRGLNSPVPVWLNVFDPTTGRMIAKSNLRLEGSGLRGRDVGGFVTAVAIDGGTRRVAASVAVLRMVGGVSESAGGAVLVWDLETGRELFRAETPTQLRAVGFDPDGRVVAGGGSASEGRVTGWDVSAKKEAYSFVTHTRPVTALVFGPDRRLATASADRTVKVWDFDTRTELLALDAPTRTVTDLVWAPGGRLLAATGADPLGMLRDGPGALERPAPAEVRVWRGK